MPFLGKLRPSTNCFMVNDRKVSLAAEVLCDSNCVIQVKDHMPISSWHEYGLAWLLKNFNWLTIRRPIGLLALRINLAEPSDCFVSLFSAHGTGDFQELLWCMLNNGTNSLEHGTEEKGKEFTVGKRHHRLWPKTRAFQAEVPRGSMWMPVPERPGPITNQRYGGLRDSPAYLKRSSRKYFGTGMSKVLVVAFCSSYHWLSSPI